MTTKHTNTRYHKILKSNVALARNHTAPMQITLAMTPLLYPRDQGQCRPINYERREWKYVNSYIQANAEKYYRLCVLLLQASFKHTEITLMYIPCYTILYNDSPSRTHQLHKYMHGLDKRIFSGREVSFQAAALTHTNKFLGHIHVIH